MYFHCDHCGSMTEFLPQVRRDGGLEIISLICPSCGNEYVGSVTDAALREDVARYKRMAEEIRTRPMPLSFILQSQRIHERNVRMNRALREQYLAVRESN